MAANQNVSNDFSKGSILKTILSMAIPITIAQAVQILYNLVDRIYLGHLAEGGDLALIGVGLCFPIITIINAFTLLFSTGGAPLMSIARGAGEHDRARKMENVCFFMILVTAFVLMAVLYIFMKPIMYAFGASDATYGTAAAYLQVYLLGTVFVMISTGMNMFINAQGFSRIGMMTVCIGAVMNIILDPIAIFVLKMGVRGAAWATVISQFAGFLWVMIFLNGSKVQYPLDKALMVPRDVKLIFRIMGLGLTGFIMSVTNSLTQIACNATLAVWGGDLYVGSMTILNSVREIFNLASTGISDGAKPVLGYNYGAKQYGRLKKAIFIVLAMMLGYMVLVWAFVHFCPTVIVRCFTNDRELIATAAPALKIFFEGYFMMGLMFTGQAVFVALGFSKQSVFFSLLRKVGIVLPLTVFLPYVIGVNGVFMAEPISNVVGGTVNFVTMLIMVMPILNGKKPAPERI